MRVRFDWIVWAAALGSLSAQGQTPVQPFTGEVDRVPIAPAGGEWESIASTNLAYNPVTNRLLTVVQDSNLQYKVIAFDASTNAFSNGEPTQVQDDSFPETSGVLTLDTVVSASENALFIAWGDVSAQFISSEASIPVRLERFELDTFAATDSTLVDVKFHQFDLDPINNRLVGIADASEESDFFVVSTVAIGDGSTSVTSEAPIGINRNDSIPRCVVYQPGEERLFVLFIPRVSSDEDPFVAAYDPISGATVSGRIVVEGEYFRHSMALSPDGKWLAVAPSVSEDGRIPLIDTSSLNITNLNQFSFSDSYSPNGASVFVDNDRVWLPNGNESRPKESIAVYNVASASFEGFIEDASESQAFQVDAIDGNVFIASFALQLIHTLSRDSARASTNVDVSVRPSDLAVDSVNNVYQLMSESGRLYLVDGIGPSFQGRFLDVAVDPITGLLNDTESDLLFVGRSETRNTKVLETDTYQEIGELPVRASTLAGDATSLYAVAFIGTSASEEAVIYQLDGDDFSIVDELDRFYHPTAETEIALDSDSGRLWVLIGGSSQPKLITYDLVNGSSSTYLFPDDNPSDRIQFPRVGNLILTEETNAAIVTVKSTVGDNDTDVRTFRLLEGVLQPDPTRVSLEADDAFDSDPDLEQGFVYYLTRDYPNTYLAAYDLQSQSLASILELDFTGVVGPARMTFNRVTDRFGIASGGGEAIYLFDNPFAFKKKPKVSGRSKALIADSGAVGQTEAGIELNWHISPDADARFKGVVVERRRDESEPWIRLTPFAVPPSLDFWTDTTVDIGERYEYRLTAVGSVAPATIVLEATASENSRWIASIPEVVVSLRPEERGTYLVSVTDLSGLTDRVSLGIDGDPGFDIGVAPQVVPVPGTAQIEITPDDETDPGVYAVWITVQDGQTTARIPLLVRVVEENLSLRRDRILRRTTPIVLTSDSELDQQRLSVRGQLGLLRRLVDPVPIVVQAKLPDGSAQEVEVIASTGEFTADFSVPETGGIGDWVFQATLPGTFEVVGGRSSRFRIPIFASGPGRKGVENFDIGQILVVTGAPPDRDNTTEVDRVVDTVLDRFEGKRFKSDRRQAESEVPNLFTPPSNKSSILEAATRLDTNQFALFYFIGDASRLGQSDIEFKLESGESLTRETIEEMVKSVRPRAIPFAIFDCPMAARFKTSLMNSAPEGAFLFAAGPEWDPPNFSVVDRTNYLSFAKAYLFFLKDDGFGKAFDKYGGFFPAAGPTARGPDWTVPAQPGGPFHDFQIGSDFVPSRSSLGDQIVPYFQKVISSEAYRLGDELRIFAEVVDTPFDGELNVRVLVRNERLGTDEILPLSRVSSSGSTMAGLYETTLLLSKPGDFSLLYQAFDSETTFSDFATSFRVCDTPMAPMDVYHLLNLIRELKTESTGPTDGDASRRIFGAMTSWCP